MSQWGGKPAQIKSRIKKSNCTSHVAQLEMILYGSLIAFATQSLSMRQEGSNDPIFVAIQMSSAENVHRLLQYSANPRSREAIPSREGHAGRRRLRRRTALEAAESHPRCRMVLLDFKGFDGGLTQQLRCMMIQYCRLQGILAQLFV